MKRKLSKMNRKRGREAAGIIMSVIMLAASAFTYPVQRTEAAQEKGSVQETKEGKITSMEYFSENDGPVLKASGVKDASYGFVMPKFNGGAVSWQDVASDLHVNVLVNGVWTDIDSVPEYVYNSNWGNWSDGGFDGYWFKADKTTKLQLQSKSNPSVVLEYTLEFTKLDQTAITSMEVVQGTDLKAGVTGSIGFVYPVFNGDTSIKYEQVAEDLHVYVREEGTTEWIDIDNNAASGWIYDQNFGQFWDGGGGYWFNVKKTTYVRLVSRQNPSVYVDYTIKYEEPVRTDHRLSAEQMVFVAGASGEIGLPLPKIDGGDPIGSELDNFVYEVKVNGAWVSIGDVAASGFSYQGNGYSKLSDKNQWGYWVDGIYGLWFQPIQEDMEFRVGYPLDGIKGGDIQDNYVTYQFKGNKDAPRPDVSDLGSIELGSSDDAAVEGWNLVWNDEFNGTSLDRSKWNYNTGYYINEDPATWGWGNNELEYYTDSEKNTYVENGCLNLKAFYEPTTFPEIDPNRTAPYSSGKITTKDSFTFKYGRIDFCAKLPTGNGIWPALWMLPDDDTYGTWAASGEIDVMEARGRLPGSTSGTIHYGGTWPANTYKGSDYIFPEGQTIDSDYHVYSLVWEEDNIKWYVDGTCFYKLTNDEWYSNGASDNPNAPFDQEFYIIMNLAVGGWFDGGIAPDVSELPVTMNVDYVRGYQEESNTNDSYTNKTGAGMDQPGIEQPVEEVPVIQSVTASGEENEATVTSNVMDGDLATRWSSNFADDAWLQLDLGKTVSVSGLTLNWEAAYGKRYEIQVSEDGVNYTTVKTVTEGTGGVEEVNFNKTKARYVKLQGIERALPYGYSLYEVSVK